MLVGALVVGCTHPETGSTVDLGGPDTSIPSPPPPPPPPTPTTTPHDAPTAITADCQPTENPLRFTCHVTVDPAQPVQIAFAKADGSGPARVHTSPDEAADHDIGLYFLAAETDYTTTATAADWPDGLVATGTLTTGAVPNDLAARLDLSGTSSTPYVGTNLPCTGAGATAAVWDTATGEMVWYQVADRDGNFGGMEMLTFTEDHTILGQSGDQVMEVDLMGVDQLRRREGVDYAEDLHHDQHKHDGLVYLLYHEGINELDGFQIWDGDGIELGRWWAQDWLDIPDIRDWMHSNAIHARDGAVYVSLYAQNTIVKVDGDLASPTFGEPEWILGGSDPMGLGTDFTIDWSKVSGTDGFAHQHDAHLLDDGRLALLDNLHGRGLVLSIDEAARTVTVDEAYPTTNPSCGPQGTMRRTAAGDFLVDCSGDTIRAFAPGGTSPVWQAEIVCANADEGPPGPGAAAERWYPLDGW